MGVMPPNYIKTNSTHLYFILSKFEYHLFIRQKVIKDEKQQKFFLTPSIRAGVPTSNNEFKQLSVFYGHTNAFYRCSGVFPVFDARCSMPPTSWKEMKMDF